MRFRAKRLFIIDKVVATTAGPFGVILVPISIFLENLQRELRLLETMPI